MNKQHDGNVGSSSDSWPDPNFWGRNKLYFLDRKLLCSHPGTLTFGFPAVSRPDLPQNVEWSGPCWKQASQWMRVLFWLQSSYRSLIMGPTGQNVLRSFGKAILHDSQSLILPSCLWAKPSRMTHCQRKSTKSFAMTAYDYWVTCMKPCNVNIWFQLGRRVH